MIRVIPVLFGALFTVATAWSLGMLLFRRLSLAFHAWEERLLAFIVGSACLSGIMFLLSATRLVHRGILLVLGLAIIGYAGIFRRFPVRPESRSRRSRNCGAGSSEWASRSSLT